MSGEDGATGTLAEPETQPPAGTDGTQADPAAGEPIVPEALSLEAGKKLRAENGSLRTRLREFEERERQAQEAQLSELDKAQKRAATLERERDDAVRDLQESRVRTAVVESAVRLGFHNPQMAMRGLDQTALAFDDAGLPTNVDALLSDLAKSDPYLVKARGSADAGAQSPASSTHTYTRDQLRDTKFFEANRVDIMAAVREGRIRG